MKNYLERIKDFFGYSRTERNGIIILFIILIFLIVLNILLPYIIKSNKTDFTEFKEKIVAFEKYQTHIDDSLNHIRSAKSYAKTEKDKLTPFPFDPNNLPVHKWREMGLKDWQIEVIKNYEMKGGIFYQAEDLAKIYSISEEEYKILKPYISMEQSIQLADEPAINPFPFDPNSVTEEELIKMGIRENLIKTIKNYRDKGGIFYTKKDFQKLYTITDAEYLQLEAYLFFERDSLPPIVQVRFTDTLLVDINTADSLDLQQLKGIGPSFSKRIIKYRELLGGYYDINQVLEVYGMDIRRFDAIKEHIYVNEVSIQKININNATIKEMIKHPYIEFYIAKSIIAYRNEIGSINELQEIKNVKLIYEELYQKIVPYLTIN